MLLSVYSIYDCSGADPISSGNFLDAGVSSVMHRLTRNQEMGIGVRGDLNFSITPTYILTNIRPVVVWPDMSSPAQSLASVIKVPSNSCLFLAFCSFCLASLGPKSGSLRQHTNANARHSNTMNNPTRNVIMLDSKKHQYFRTLRHSSASNEFLILKNVYTHEHSTHMYSELSPERTQSLRKDQKSSPKVIIDHQKLNPIAFYSGFLNSWQAKPPNHSTVANIHTENLLIDL
uniref:Uncharacterized protein n=1 Tax=Glossina austeni TaxID=7395 RepID=A0A1A9UQ55_GLOAU